MQKQSNEENLTTINIDEINNIVNESSKSIHELIKSYDELFEIYREAIKCKKDTAVSIYTDDTLPTMYRRHDFNIKLYDEKDKTDFFNFVIWGVIADCKENEERISLSHCDFILSITGREVQHKAIEYYNELRISLEQTDTKQLSAPAPKVKDKKEYPDPVIMMVAIIINGIEGESFLPEEANYEKRVELTIDAIYDKLKFRVGTGIRNHFNPKDKLTKNNKEKVFKLLDSLGFTKQARAFKHDPY